jgi:hypothetical protein
MTLHVTINYEVIQRYFHEHQVLFEGSTNYYLEI